MNFESKKFDNLIHQIQLLIENALQLRKDFHLQLEQIHPHYQASATNLVDYLALRQFDVRSLQEQLSELGMSSLGRSEGHVMASLQQVLKLLLMLENKDAQSQQENGFITFQQSTELLEQSTERLFGKKPVSREVRIMVTLPDEAAYEAELVQNMMLAGMDTARINCSHGDETLWAGIIQQVRKSAHLLNKECMIMMDLAGPKLRTGSLSHQLQILKLRPEKNNFGQVTQLAAIWFFPSHQLPENNPQNIPVIQFDTKWLQEIKVNDTIVLHDCRGKSRKLKVVDKVEDGFSATCGSTTYIDANSIFKLKNKNGIAASPLAIFGRAQPLILKTDDILELHKHQILGKNAEVDESGKLIAPAQIACQMPEIFMLAKIGEPVKLNDGKIEGIIQKISEAVMEIKITLASEKGSNLREEKGINFPKTNISLAEISQKDLKDLDFVSQNADLVALSFVHTKEDIQNLLKEIKKRNATHLGIILKIETQNGFKQLPSLLLTGMQHPSFGVMIARGDLAVECGWIRMAEVQEEILWLCEAAHIPVVWATQVLENLAQKGIPSRAEITDAAMSQRADCVMLNKGTYILKAIVTLNEILNKMQNHQLKKSAQLRKLAVTDFKIELNK